jgi:GT2 family glycosyltransferase
MQPDPIDLSIVIVNYNTCALLLDCLKSIYDKPQSIAIECIVVDNASTDGSTAAVRSAFPAVRLIANTQRGYFSEGNNQGIAIARGRYVIALNPDMSVLGDCLSQLVQQMDARPEIGAATTSMYFPDGELQRNGSREVTLHYLILQYSFLGKLFPAALCTVRDWLWYADWDRQTEHELGVLPGSCIIARRDVWKSVGGFDARMPMYFSDDYVSRQVRNLGKQTWYLVSDGIIHYEGSSTRVGVKKKLTRWTVNMYFHDLLVFVGLVFGLTAQIGFAIVIVPTYLVQLLTAQP